MNDTVDLRYFAEKLDEGLRASLLTLDPREAARALGLVNVAIGMRVSIAEAPGAEALEGVRAVLTPSDEDRETEWPMCARFARMDPQELKSLRQDLWTVQFCTERQLSREKA